VPGYPTDLTYERWAALEPPLPPMACDAPRGGRPEKHRRRAVADAIFYVADNGVKWWALLPGCLLALADRYGARSAGGRPAGSQPQSPTSCASACA
jgi:hypothetical protein